MTPLVKDTRMHDSPPQVPAGQLRTMQIINFALVMGVVSFLAFALFQRLGNPQPAANADFDFLPWIAIGMLAMGAIAGPIIGMTIEKANLVKLAAGTWQPPEDSPAEHYASTEAKLLAGRQTGLIIRLALVEGPAFLAVLTYFTSGSLLGLATALVALLLLIAPFPTQGRTERWLERQQQRLTEMQQLTNKRSAPGINL